MDDKKIGMTSNQLFKNIVALVNKTRTKAAVFLNTETTLLYWSIGLQIKTELKQKDAIIYGKQIIVTLSQQLS